MSRKHRERQTVPAFDSAGYLEAQALSTVREADKYLSMCRLDHYALERRIEADPGVRKLDIEWRNLQKAYSPFIELQKERWTQLSGAELENALIVQKILADKTHELRRRFRNRIESRFRIPNLTDEIDRPSRFFAWLERRTQGLFDGVTIFKLRPKEGWPQKQSMMYSPKP